MSTFPPNDTPTAQKAGDHQRTTATLWALATFVVLGLCSTVALVLLATGGKLPELDQGPSWTPLPVTSPPPTTAIGGGPQERSPEQPFLPGDAIQNVSGGRVNLRQTPGFQNKPSTDVVAVLEAGIVATVVAGPTQADGLRWWLIRFGPTEGWMAERSNSGKVLLGPGS